MSRTTRGGLAALVALIVSIPLAAASPAVAGPRAGEKTAHFRQGSTSARGGFTAGQAKSILARVERQLTPAASSGRSSRPAEAGRKRDLTLTLRDLSVARSSLTGADRARADAILARPTNGSNVDPVKYGRAKYRYHCFSGSPFCIHWVTDGANRVNTTDSDHDGIPNYVESVYATMTRVYSYEIGTLSYRRPLNDAATDGVRGNPNSKFDVYLAELGSIGLYGYCAPEGASNRTHLPGYCVLDNNYSPSQYGSSSYLLPLRVTAAHEFFHAVQFGYDALEDPWFMEGTSTWIEDEVYPTINDNLQYLSFSPIRHPDEPVDYTTDLYRYGDWVFFKFASEYLRNRVVVRQMWEDADSSSGTRYSIQAIRRVVTARGTSWNTFAAEFGAWNTLTPGTYQDRKLYPTPVYTKSKTLGTAYPRTAQTSNLMHMARTTISVRPASSLPPTTQLRIDINGPALSHGVAALAQLRFKSDGHTKDYPVTLDADGDGTAVLPFSPATVASVAIVTANTSTDMVDCDQYAGNDGYPAFSCGGIGRYDSVNDFTGETFVSTATLQ